MSKKKKREPASVDEIEVTLKPIAGIPPWTYLTVIYIIIVLFICFLLFLLPGIRNHGSMVSFNSRPEQAAVYIDGEYAGATPHKAFVSQGNHTFEIIKPYYQKEEWNKEIPGKFFFTLFAPKKINFMKTLTAENADGFFQSVSGEFSSYALLDSLYVSYQIPHVLSRSVETLYNTETPPSKEEIERFLRHASSNVHNDVLLRDFLKAVSTHSAGGSIMTPQSIIDLVQLYIKAEDSFYGIDFLLTASLPASQRQEVKASGWYQTISERYEEQLLTTREYIGEPDASPVTIGDILFYSFPAGGFIKGLSSSEPDIASQFGTSRHPHFVRVESFFLSAQEITKEQFARFLQDSSQWDPANKSILQETGLVDENYLKNWNEIKKDEPVSYVSFFAAEAYCDWLATQLPASLSAYTVSLPSEDEWEYAARSQWDLSADLFKDKDAPIPQSYDSASSSLSAVKQLKGNLWEWCGNWYFPAAYSAATIEYFSIDSEENSRFSGAEKAVRGGSWANQSQEIDYATRGSQPPTWCTPFTGFRPVITLIE